MKLQEVVEFDRASVSLTKCSILYMFSFGKNTIAFYQHDDMSRKRHFFLKF